MAKKNNIVEFTESEILQGRVLALDIVNNITEDTKQVKVLCDAKNPDALVQITIASMILEQMEIEHKILEYEDSLIFSFDI